ncbi:Thyroid receptor-interacting protein 11 [Plecturocebus cupreus]
MELKEHIRQNEEGALESGMSYPNCIGPKEAVEEVNKHEKTIEELSNACNLNTPALQTEQERPN